MNENNSMDAAKDAVLDAALAHVPFDGWSAATLIAATADSGVAPGLVSALFPRGAVDLALAYHHRVDGLMRERFAAENHDGLRYSEKVARAVRLRLEAATDKEAVRRGTTLFALPQHAADGAKAIWGTADAIWLALGDTSTDLNWYTKRATLSAVYASTVLFWLGDDSTDHQATWDFLDRRITNVMQIEKFKSQMRDNPLAKAFAAGPGRWFDKIKAPIVPTDLPGSFMDRFRH
jgi:ubiquinone biosynthesis protein COQ9